MVIFLSSLKPPIYSLSLLCFSFFYVYFLLITLPMRIKIHCLITSNSNVTPLMLIEPRSEIMFAWPEVYELIIT